MPQPALDTHAEVRKLKQAGCPEEQAAAMVDLVSRAPVNAQITNSLNRLEAKVDSIEANMAGMATKSDLDRLRAETKADLELLRAETKVDRGEAKADIEALRASMTRMLWIQGLALATLIISLAGIMLGLGAMPA
ncbi:MAG: DUF1640 domain-containing protein [Gammaproteobacteria bacterium]|nr:DUF1640 domain-containing protein [Gammaproteobacteria bacterium]MYI25424.1 DUF1640 domain-containing protein [Gammaproteobacteria bacterium]